MKIKLFESFFSDDSKLGNALKLIKDVLIDLDDIDDFDCTYHITDDCDDEITLCVFLKDISNSKQVDEILNRLINLFNQDGLNIMGLNKNEYTWNKGNMADWILIKTSKHYYKQIVIYDPDNYSLSSSY